jgi:hypothetical protein
VSDPTSDFSGLTALFINTTLTRSPGSSHTQLLVDAIATIMAKQGVQVDQFRAVHQPIATGVYPDMREHGWEIDGWPELFPRVLAADILVIAGPIWLGDNSSETNISASGSTPTPVNSTTAASGCTTARSAGA